MIIKQLADQGQILVEIVGELEKNLGEVQRSRAYIEWAKVNDVSYMHVVYICISVLMNYDCTTHPILPFIPNLQLLQSFFQNLTLKGYLTQR
jgi:hypothetical protein